MVSEPITEPFIDNQLGRNQIAEHFKTILLNTNLNVFSLVEPGNYNLIYGKINLSKIPKV